MMLGTRWDAPQSGNTINQLREIAEKYRNDRRLDRPNIAGARKRLAALYSRYGGEARTNLTLTGGSLTEYDYDRISMVTV